MVFKDNQTLTNLYAGITKKVEPSQDQIVQQAPVLSNTALSKDQDLLSEAYASITNQEIIEEAKKKSKPDFMDVDGDNKKDESLKKALKDKAKKKSTADLEEELSFKNLYGKVMIESKKQETVCGTKINPKFQYKCVMKDGTNKTLLGSSVLGLSDKIKSVTAAHKK
jgi:hypothetical protein